MSAIVDRSAAAVSPVTGALLQASPKQANREEH
jgi:hypothetical protein